ncbi:N-acetylgalactosamine-N, N'-diacetylbacillosaminyl-diphospho-undecaprenol 4-alpha-N-acetylgalactosaminyltransferase [Gammaproteobacteria bacterium]
MSTLSQRPLALFAATSGHSGVDRLIANLLPELARWGDPVDLLTIHNHGPFIENPPPGVRLVALPATHVHTALPALVGYLRRHHPRALLTDKDKVNRLALLATRLVGGTRLVVRTGMTASEDLARQRAPKRLVQWLSMRYLYRLADAVLVPSQGVAEDLAKNIGLPRARIQVIHNPIVTPAFTAAITQPVEHPWLMEKTWPVIMGLGELCERKDFETLLRAFAQVRNQRPCRLLIYGRGRRETTLHQLADDLGVGEVFDLPGFIANPYPALAAADVFVQSSRYEGFGNALAEALAAGTPVVATDCPHGPREILANGHYGTLVPVGDVAGLARAIQETLQNPPSPVLLAEAAAPYQIETIARQYRDLLLGPLRQD